MSTEEMILQRLDTIIRLLEAKSQFDMGCLEMVASVIKAIPSEIEITVSPTKGTDAG